ncbi:MAG: type IVB secretion system protein IcmF [Legionellales bacterium]|nr:type IVB secretion system protein IcmF [Legionellales bacterium]
MNNSLKSLCDALKQIFIQLKPQSHLSFLVVTGRANQGKSTLMRQSNFDQYPIDAEGANIYFNPQGVIVELGETWINQDTHLLENTLKQLNRVHRLLKITGILLCVDINELLIANHSELKELLKANTKLLERFGLGLNYPVDVAIIITKMDLLAGFCDFFQSEHPSDMAKPMGFSIYDASKPNKIQDIFKTKFEQFVEQLGQQVTSKIHPIRSNTKRTSIREFPLQAASLRNLILPLASSISARLFRLQALYFTSAEQGGVILDRLNKKIQHEFSLVVQDQFYQSTNYRSYFIEGALFAFQTETQRNMQRLHPKHKRITLGISASSILVITWIGYYYVSSSQVLDHVQHELQVAQHLKNASQSSDAIYHLSQANSSLNTLSSKSRHLTMIKNLQKNLKTTTQDQLMHNFVPQILSDLEQALRESNQSQISRYQTLKIYLMLTDNQHFQQDDILDWFTQRWQSNPKELDKKLTLLQQLLHRKMSPIAVNRQLIADVRNYLNALPPNYLYYSLAKTQISDTKQTAIDFQGFQVGSSYIPDYVTQKGYQKIMAKLPDITQQLIAENWILERQDTQNILGLLQQAYCNDYAIWWQHFLHNTKPLRAQDYAQVHQLTQTLIQSQSIPKLIKVIQTHTHPISGPNAELFNREIASKFSDLNLLSSSNLQQLSKTVTELDKFSNTLSLVSDQGKTAYTLTKARFQSDKLTNPISELYEQAQQFPEPLTTWATQIADDMWFNLIADTRNYINHRWQASVYNDYQIHIAHHYPLDTNQSFDLSLDDFNRFFGPHGVLNQFSEEYIKPFLDTSQAQWQRKELNHVMIPITDELIKELIRANVITHMFFPHQEDRSYIEFSLQKINLDPVVAELQLHIGDLGLTDNQTSDSFTEFHWPQRDAQLILRSIQGKQFELSESGVWGIFKLLQKVNVLVDEQDSTNLQILFEINGNSGRYLLKAQNQVNPFIPGILAGFNLQDHIA